MRAGERSYLVLVEEEGQNSHPFSPDVRITTERRRKSARKKVAATVAEGVLEAKPVLMRAFIEEEHREAFVEIYEATREQRLVTSIEVLSPSNKPRTRRDGTFTSASGKACCWERQTWSKLTCCGGRRMPMLDVWPDSAYTLLVARARNTACAGSGRSISRRRCRNFPSPWPSRIQTFC